jgi:glycosyltransferase involved in cell wall biosynthesis
MTTGRILFLLKGYPRLSETFIAQEIYGLEQRGLKIHIAAMRRPTDPRVHAIHRHIKAPVSYLPEYLHEEFGRVFGALLRALRNRRFFTALRMFCDDLKRDRSRNRFRRFGQALVLADELSPLISQIHAHFIHTPSSVARYASILTGVPWSCSAHAKDIWTSPDWELRDKLSAAQFAVTCTQAGQARLNALAPIGRPVQLVYHGLDLHRFSPLSLPRPRLDGSDPILPIRLLTVGRAVEKKGLDIILDALAQLPKDLHWKWTHIGGGELLNVLQLKARELGLADRIVWLGSQDQEIVLAQYRNADIFVLPCRIAGDGDRDGLPNVLVEAQSQSLACIATPISGIPELLGDGTSGLFVPPDNPQALSQAVVQLTQDPDLRLRLGKAGARRVVQAFDHQRALAELMVLFTGTPVSPGTIVLQGATVLHDIAAAQGATGPESADADRKIA